jgi:hypothetical protein
MRRVREVLRLRHVYSVPSRLIGEVVEARITDTTIEIFYRGTRVASHAFSPVRNRHTTIPVLGGLRTLACVFGHSTPTRGEAACNSPCAGPLSLPARRR